MDNHATTRVDPRVLEAMLPYFTEKFGNPGSVGHAFGEDARDAADAARDSIAAALGADSKEIVFTSGATESNNLAFRGVAERDRRRGNHIVSVTTEHKAVLDPLARLARRGYEVTRLEVDQAPSPRAGWLDPQRVADALRDDTCLVTVMLANNEIGVIQPLPALAQACRARGVWLHTDAVQAVGHVPFDVESIGADLVSLTAHKMYGPKGTGALYVRRSPRVEIEPLFTGGGQERGLRPGTLNVPGIVGLGAAAELSRSEQASEGPRVSGLRDRLLAALQAGVEAVTVNGSMSARLPHNLHVSFAGVDGEALMTGLADDIAASSGSACASGSREPSHVVKALGLGAAESWGAVRFGLGRTTTAEDVDFAAARVVALVQRLRALSPVEAQA
jgi:cysteine desulfurase